LYGSEVSQGAPGGCIARLPLQQEAQDSPGGGRRRHPFRFSVRGIKRSIGRTSPPSPRRRPPARCLNRQVINEARREQLRRPRSRCNRSRSYVMFQFALFYSTLLSLASARARATPHRLLARSLIAYRLAPPRLSISPRQSPHPQLFPTSSALLVNDSSIRWSEGVSATPP
jgi:hypothetical protein